MLSPDQTNAPSRADVRRISALCTLVAAIAALTLLPAGIAQANWLTDVFKGKDKKSEAHAEAPRHAKDEKKKDARKSAKREKETKHAAASKSHVKLAALGPLNPPVLKLASSHCEPAKFRIAVDVGHTVESEGATSSRNVPEFSFNLRLAQQVAGSIKRGDCRLVVVVLIGLQRLVYLIRHVVGVSGERHNCHCEERSDEPICGEQ